MLEGFGEFFSKSTLGTLRTGTRLLVLAASSPRSFCTLRSNLWTSTSRGRMRTLLRLGRLCRIGAQEPVFERRAIEAPDNRIHFFRVWRVDESEAF